MDKTKKNHNHYVFGRGPFGNVYLILFRYRYAKIKRLRYGLDGRKTYVAYKAALRRV